MPLHLVGETIDKTRSHYLAETGKLVQLMRGIYVDAADDIDQTVLAHAVRMGRYLYPNAYLSAASACEHWKSSRTRPRRSPPSLLPRLPTAWESSLSMSRRSARGFWRPFACAANMPRPSMRPREKPLPPALPRSTAARRPQATPYGRWPVKTTGIARAREPRSSCCAALQLRPHEIRPRSP